MKQKIESKLNVTKSEHVELHVLVANPASWRPDSWQAYERGASISIGFVKAEYLTTLFDLRSLLIQQLRPESLPDQYVYLRTVGRGATVCSSRQERTLRARDFAPPFYAHAEICILSSENMAFQSRYREMLPALASREKYKPKLNGSLNGSMFPPLSPTKLGLNHTAPITSIERSKSPSFRSLQSLEGSSFSMFQNTELMMAEINFLEAKKALADAHAHALRNQYLMSQRIVMEGDSEEDLSEKDDEEDEERKRQQLEDEEEERKRIEEERKKMEAEEDEREQIRQQEDLDRQRLLEIEEQKRKIFEERKRREQEIEDEIREEEEKAMAVFDVRRKQAEKKRLAEEARLAELERVALQEEEDRRKRAQELERKRKEEEERKKREREEENMKREQENLAKNEQGSDDEEVDAAMKLIETVTNTPRPWAKDGAKKIKRVPKDYSKEELEEMAYIRAKIETFRGHRVGMETKHHDLLVRLAEMEQNWNEEEADYESNWRPKCKEEEKKTPQLYERNRQLRLELQMLYKQADTVISHAQAMKATDDRKGMAFPSIKNNLRINLQKLQAEVTEQRKRVATANIKYEAEKSNREAVEKEVKQLRQELINSKISSSVTGR